MFCIKKTFLLSRFVKFVVKNSKMPELKMNNCNFSAPNIFFNKLNPIFFICATYNSKSLKFYFSAHLIHTTWGWDLNLLQDGWEVMGNVINECNG